VPCSPSYEPFLRNIAKKYQKEIAYELKKALEDETKMQELTLELERINKELKRRSRVVGAFPSDESFMRLGVPF
jgi:transposase-like protein